MSNLSVFAFDSQDIEVVILDNKPWFNASQVAKALGYGNTTQALQDNVSAKYIRQIDLGRRGSKPNFVNEPGLYQLIMRSNLPSAERFQDWVFEEVLPSIRKNGVYQTTDIVSKKEHLSLVEQLNIAESLLVEMGIDPTIIKQLKLDSAAKQLPVSKDMLEAGKKLLGSQNPLDSVGLTPTEIGSQLQPLDLLRN